MDLQQKINSITNKIVHGNDDIEALNLINDKDQYIIDTVLVTAVKYKKVNIVEKLLEYGANPKEAFLRIASDFTNTDYEIDIINLLINKTTNINLADNFGDTVLIKSAQNNNKKLVELLLKKNADVNIQNKDIPYFNVKKETALMFAVTHNHDRIVELLLERKDINLDITNKDGKTALMIAAESSYKNIDIISKLIPKTTELIDEAWTIIDTNYSDSNKNILKPIIDERKIQIKNEKLEKLQIFLASSSKTEETQGKTLVKNTEPLKDMSSVIEEKGIYDMVLSYLVDGYKRKSLKRKSLKRKSLKRKSLKRKLMN